jgi:hypothetical protein
MAETDLSLLVDEMRKEKCIMKINTEYIYIYIKIRWVKNNEWK